MEGMIMSMGSITQSAQGKSINPFYFLTIFYIVVAAQYLNSHMYDIDYTMPVCNFQSMPAIQASAYEFNEIHTASTVNECMQTASYIVATKFSLFNTTASLIKSYHVLTPIIYYNDYNVNSRLDY